MPIKKLSVAFLFDDSLDNSDGVANQVKTLGGWLSSQGYDVSYLVGETKMRSWKGGKVYSLAKNVPVRFNSNWLSIPLPANRQKIKQALAQSRPDILHVQMPHSPFMSQVVMSQAKNIPTVGTFHIYPSGVIAKIGGRILKLMYLNNLNKIDEIVSVSYAAKDFAKSAFGIRSTVIPNMVEMGRYESAKASNQPGRIVFLGRLVERKGCEYLIRAFSQLHKQQPEASLVVAGDGPQREHLERLAKKLGASQSIEFMGKIPEADKADLLASAQIACFPSVSGESFGVVLIEAMAAGSGIVLGGNNPGYQGVLASMPQALFNPLDTSALAVKLAHFMQKQDEANNLHLAQQQLVKQFDVAVVGPQVENLYSRVIAKRNKNRHNKS